MFSLISRSAKETFTAAKQFAKLLRGGEVLALLGELGSGKTTFLKGLAKGLGIKTKLVSPSFVILSRHKLPAGKHGFFYHFDLYRLKKTADLAELGFFEILQERKSLTAIEWAEKIKKYLPSRAVIIKFKHGKTPSERKIEIYA